MMKKAEVYPCNQIKGGDSMIGIKNVILRFDYFELSN